MEPKVTIITGTYKKTDAISKTIESILNQTFADFIFIIVDDNHPDDIEIISKTKESVFKYSDSRIIYIKNDINIGVPFVFQKWIDLVKTEYFYICGDGDCLLPGAREKMVSYLDKHPRASMVHGLETKGNGVKDAPLYPDSRTVDPLLYLEFHLIGNDKIYSWSQASAMFRREFWIIKKIPVVHDHYWDFYFHCKYLLFSQEIGYLNDYVSVREKAIITYEEYTENNYFLVKVERLYQAAKFIDEHECFMIQKEYPVIKYRYYIARKLLKESFKVKRKGESLFCIRLSMSLFIKNFIGYFVWIILYPLRLLLR